MTITSPPRRNGLPMLLLVVSLLALPFVIAAGLYFVGWQPARTVQSRAPAQPAAGPARLPVCARPTARRCPRPNWAASGCSC